MRTLLFILIQWLIWCEVNAFATPVYLQPDSPFATGNHSRAWLDANTKSVQTQRWFEVETRDHTRGWIPEDFALTALHLCDRAILAEDAPARTSPDLDAVFGKATLAKGREFLVQDIVGSWARVQTLDHKDDSAEPIWIPTESLLPSHLTPRSLTRGFVHTRTRFLILPGAHAHAFGELEPETVVDIVTSHKSAKDKTLEPADYVEVSHGSDRGFVRRNDLWLVSDFSNNSIHPRHRLTTLRSEPLPYASEVRSVPPSATLTLRSTRSVRWGHVKTADLGWVWWPMDEEIAKSLNESSASRERLSTEQMSTRKITALAESRSVPSLKFASANGIYRTLDGENWSEITQFKNLNYPLAIAGNGSVFVGPFMSDDDGETFTQWIRWDTLIAVLGHTSEPTKNVRITSIEPLDSNARKLAITLELGANARVPSTAPTEPAQLIRMTTFDQGKSWWRAPLSHNAKKSQPNTATKTSTLPGTLSTKAPEMPEPRKSVD